MTHVQKLVLVALMRGGYVQKIDFETYTVYDSQGNPKRRFKFATWFKIQRLTKKSKRGHIISKSKVRALHGGTWAKKTYKKIYNEK